MGVGYSLTVGWQMLSLMIVLGSLAGISYLIWDAHKESQELAELDMAHQEVKDLRTSRRYRAIG
jgi:hypothetical protein